MSATEWKLGDVASWEFGNRDPLIALRVGPCRDDAHPEGPHWHLVNGGWSAADQYARRLLVLDPESADDVERVTAAYESNPGVAAVHGMLRGRIAHMLRELANPTPRIDEPGTWGVVEAACVHSTERLHWMRREDDSWWPFIEYGKADCRPLPDDWDSLIDPVLVREGVPD